MKDGTALLPTDVRIENVVKVFIDGREIPVRDLRTAGRRLNCNRWLTFPLGARETGGRYMPKLSVVYEAPYEPIRQTGYNGAVSIDKDNNTISIYDCEFIPGDILTITISGVTAEHINLLDVAYDAETERGYILTVGNSELDALNDTSEKAVIEREITDRTVCGAPYDTMYKYYILARIAQCQHDTDMYTQYIQEFNSLLARYKLWLSARIPNEPIRFKNVW